MILLHKKSNQIRSRLSAFNKYYRGIVCLAAAICIAGASSVSALTGDDVQSLIQQHPYYDPAFTSGYCGPTNGSIGATLPANIPDPYNALLSQAAAAYRMNPQFLAAIFLSENSNTWKPFDTAWATSGQPPTAFWPDGKIGARGPFQFEPGTWDSAKVDGNNDKKFDPDDMTDAAYSAANLLSGYAGLEAPLGSLDTPFKANTLLEAAAAYNWGPGNVQRYTLPSSSISGNDPKNPVPTETQNYIKNIYSLISSGFTKTGDPNSGPSNAIGASAGSSLAPASTSGCSGGVVAGSVVQTAINLSWPSAHKPLLDPRPEYITALQEHNSSVAGSAADCGVFVATVMRASGADPDYPPSGTAKQEEHVRSHPDKYQVIQLSATDTTAIFQPGDILIVNANGGQGAKGHTMIIVGNQPGGNEASASLNERMPSISKVSSVTDTEGRGYYVLARLK